MEFDVHGYGVQEEYMDEDDDRSSTSSRIDPELEIALYSQIHFEQNSSFHDADNQILVVEEALRKPEPEEIKWRERILENNTATSLSDKKSSERTSQPGKKKSELAPKVKSSSAAQFLTSKKTVSEDKKCPSPRSKKNTRKDATKDIRKSAGIGAFLIRDDEPENKVDAMNKKQQRCETSTPKSRVAITISEDSSDDDIRELSIEDLIVIDSITDSDGSNKGEEAGRSVIEISDSDESEESENMFRVKRYSSSSDSSDYSICEVNESTDIQMNVKGLPRVPLSSQNTRLLENDNWEESPDATIEDVLNSLPECDWTLSMADTSSVGMSTPATRSRYFKRLNVLCHNCNERGHLSRDCSHPKKKPVCILCGLEGHRMKTCPLKCCYNCYRIGHSRESCHEPRKRPFAHCNRCRMKGHIESDCTDIWRQYHMTTEIDTFLKRPKKVNQMRFCYNCAQRGHFGYECREETMDYYKVPQYPLIARYCKTLPHDLPPENIGSEKRDKYPAYKKNRKSSRSAEFEGKRKPDRGWKYKKAVYNSDFVRSAKRSAESGEPKRKRPRMDPKHVQDDMNYLGHENIKVTLTKKSGKGKKGKQKSEYEGDFVRNVTPATVTNSPKRMKKGKNTKKQKPKVICRESMVSPGSSKRTEKLRREESLKENKKSRQIQKKKRKKSISGIHKT